MHFCLWRNLDPGDFLAAQLVGRGWSWNLPAITVFWQPSRRLSDRHVRALGGEYEKSAGCVLNGILLYGAIHQPLLRERPLAHAADLLAALVRLG